MDEMPEQIWADKNRQWFCPAPGQPWAALGIRYLRADLAASVPTVVEGWQTIDSFPLKYEEFLFYDGKNVSQGFMQWDKYDGYYWTSMTGSEIKPTHWMSLPDHPKQP